MKKIDLSIIIVSYNTKLVTTNCIKSVYDLVKNISFEIIVIDNASSDGSLSIFEKYQKSNKNFRVVKNKSNLGFSKANNQGIEIAQGEFVLLLNSDTIVQKKAIENLLEFARSKQDAGVIAPKLLNKDKSVQESVIRFPTIINAIKQYFFGIENSFGKTAPQSDTPIEVDAVVGAAFLITPKALEKIGGLNEKYFFYYEDIDYCRSVWKSGLKVYYYPKSEIIHLHGGSGKKFASTENQWRRLIPSSKVYHGIIGHYVLTWVLWLGQKIKRLKSSHVQ